MRASTKLAGAGLALGAAADVVTTWALLGVGGNETNGLVETIAPSAALFGALKLATFAALVPWLWLLAQIRRWLPPVVLAVLALAHIPIIAANVGAIGDYVTTIERYGSKA